MIRLNDINKTVIDEKSINEYYSQDEMGLNTIRMIIGGTYENVMYPTKEARDKDIEFLDQLFEVKSIEDKANAYPHELDALKFAMSGIKQECEPVKKEEYLTWDEVCNKKGEYFSAEISNVLVTLLYNGHEITIFNGNAIASFVYSKDLFNALKLKKVE
jgi:hypothetical protein